MSARQPSTRTPKAAAVKGPLEAEVQRACIQWLALHGIWAKRNNVGMIPVRSAAAGTFRRSSERGASDLYGSIPRRLKLLSGDVVFIGQFLAVECKRPGGPPPTKEQLQYLADVRAAGGIAIVARSTADLEAVLGTGIYR